MAHPDLTLFQPGGTDYVHLITTGTPGFSDLPTALRIDMFAVAAIAGFFRQTAPAYYYLHTG